MGEPKEQPFLDDPEALEEEIDFDALDDGADGIGSGGGPSRADGTANVDAVIAERDEMRDRLMRALAEAENVRKRAQRDRDEAGRYGGSKLARDLLPVYDNLKRAMEAAEEQPAIREGIALTLRELTGVFERHSVTVIAPAEGDRFDPQQHQAMFEAPVPGTKAGEIIQVMAEGFMLHDRLLRPAQVGVSSTPAS